MTLRLAALYVTYRHEVTPDPGLSGIPALIVDNTEGGAYLGKKGAATLFRPGRNLGFAKAINVGATMLGWKSGPQRSMLPSLVPETGPPDLLLVINPDARIAAGSIEDAVRMVAQDPDLGVLGPLVVTEGLEVFPSARSFPDLSHGLYNRTSLAALLNPGHPKLSSYLWPPWNDARPPARDKLLPVLSGRSPFAHAPVVPVDWVSGAAMILRKEGMEQIGGMDESFFMYVEDIDLCRRMLQKGWKTGFWPGLVVEHDGGGCSRQVPIAALAAHHRSLWKYYRKWLMRGGLESAAVAFGITLRLVARLLKPNPAHKPDQLGSAGK